MVYRLKCDCNERVGIEIDSAKLFVAMKQFFEEQVENGTFYEETNKQPYYIWSDGVDRYVYIATKWYRCNCCGCLWEFNYPDFPECGFIRKFDDGTYTGTEKVTYAIEDIK